jgi:hypothetical protein
VIEGETLYGRLLGKVIAPGGPHDQSTYRSEIAGIAAKVFFVNKICEFFYTGTGGIEFACDGLSALNRYLT